MGRNGNLGLKPQAVMECAFGAGSDAAGAARVERLSFSTYFPAAWLHFGRDADGSDRSLLHAQPFCPLEIWPGSRGPVIATPPDRVSPLKVLRAP